jgi:hypothetical protein
MVFLWLRSTQAAGHTVGGFLLHAARRWMNW